MFLECLRARQLALIQEESYIPECRETGTFQPMQCDRYNGSCFCVDELTGIPFTGTASGPGHPLPLCGCEFFFTISDDAEFSHFSKIIIYM